MAITNPVFESSPPQDASFVSWLRCCRHGMLVSHSGFLFRVGRFCLELGTHIFFVSSPILLIQQIQGFDTLVGHHHKNSKNDIQIRFARTQWTVQKPPRVLRL